VWYFFVETKGYTLEEIASIFETPGLNWKQRRNYKGPIAYQDVNDAEEGGDGEKKTEVTDVKEL
jgi:hypothetical protein